MNPYAAPLVWDAPQGRTLPWRLARVLPAMVGVSAVVMASFNACAWATFKVLGMALPGLHLAAGNAALVAYLLAIAWLSLRIYRHRIGPRGLDGFSAFGSRVHLDWDEVVEVRQRRLLVLEWLVLRGPDRRLWLPRSFLRRDEELDRRLDACPRR